MESLVHNNLDRTTLNVNGFSLNLLKASLTKGERTIHLTPKEVKLLALLMQSPGEVVSRETLMKRVWDTEYIDDTRTLDVHICWLRQKVESDPKSPEYIVTKRGKGYLLNT